MAISGLDVYKLLPKTNCKECGFPTCLAFAMKLAAKQADLSACPYVSEESKAKLSAASAPPIRLVTVAADGHKIEAGNETVLFRHEKTFYHPTGLFVRVEDSLPAEQVAATAKAVADYKVDYVGISLHLDGIAVEDRSADASKFAAAVAAARQAAQSAVGPDERGSGGDGGRTGQDGRHHAPHLRRHCRQLGSDGEAGQRAQGAPGRSRRDSRRSGGSDREAGRRRRRRPRP